MMNWDRVDELRREVGPEAFVEVLELFLDETDEVAARLAGPPDPGALASDLHFMKGAALNLGFEALAAKCAEAEATLRERDTGAVDLAAILDVYARSKADLNAADQRARAS